MRSVVWMRRCRSWSARASENGGRGGQRVTEDSTGLRGPKGDTGPPGARGEPGKDASLDDVERLAVGKGSVDLDTRAEGGGISLRNRSGEKRADLGVSTTDHGYVDLYGSSGKRSVWIGAFPNVAGGGLEFSNRTGNRRVNIGVSAHDTGDINLYGPSGKRAVWIGILSGGEGEGLQLNNNTGNLRVDLGVNASGSGYANINGKNVNDYAEVLDLATRDGIRPGSVVAYDSAAGGLVPASTSNAGRVVGVISGAGGFSPGMVIGSRADESNDLPVSMAGVVHVRVSAEAGTVQPGDLLVPSSVAGVGMRSADPVAATGTIFGKALEPWSGDGEGLVMMLVMNR